MFVVDKVFFECATKISPDDQENFKHEFGYELCVRKALYDGNDECTYIKYSCNPPLLLKFRNYLRDWLKNAEFPLWYFTITDSISLHVNEKLYKNQIQSFEEEFEVKCSEYSISCNSNKIEYEFR